MNELKAIFKSFLPQNKSEVIVIIASFIFYFILSVIFLLNTAIINFPAPAADLYFSFDNARIFNDGIDNVEGHPMLKLITYPIINIGYILAHITHSELIRALLIIFVCTYLTASSVMFVYRYLKNIANTPTIGLYILTLFFGCSATPLLLCFTFESFTFSLFFLTSALLYFSQKKESGINYVGSIFYGLTLGGITITNMAKVIGATLFNSKSIKKILLSACICIGIVGTFLVLYIFYVKPNIYDAIVYRIIEFSKVDERPFEMLIVQFLGSSILFPPIGISFERMISSMIIVAKQFDQVWEYVFVITLYLLVLISFIANYKNKAVQLLAIFWSIDLIIHIIFKYGIADPLIYGGHWIFIVPMVLGWLYNKLPVKLEKVYTGVLAIFLLILVVNNFYGMSQLFHFAKILFPQASL